MATGSDERLEGFFELHVLGDCLSLRHDADQRSMQEAATLLKHKVEIVQSEYPLAKDSLRVMILTAFHLVVELMGERSERAMVPTISVVESQEIERLLREMSVLLDSAEAPVEAARATADPAEVS